MAYFKKDNAGCYSYSYYGVTGTIYEEYVNPEMIDSYISDKSFLVAVKNSYSKIDISGNSLYDLARFQRRMERTAKWLRKQANTVPRSPF